MNKKDLRHLTVSLEYNGPITAPIDKGTEVANIIVSKKDEVIKKIPLYALRFKKINFLKFIKISELFDLGDVSKKTFFYCF